MEQKSVVLSAAYLWLHQTLGLYILLGEKLISDRSGGGAGREEGLGCYEMFGHIETLAA